MPPISRFLLPRRREAALAAVLGVAAVAWACGPDFPNRYLDAPDAQLLAAPEASFAAEVTDIAATVAVPQRAVPTTHVEVAAIDVQEIRDVLQRAGKTAENIVVATEDYSRAREAISGDEPEAWRGRGYWPPMADVPAEFALYFEGATAWSKKHWTTARERWSEILKLPAADRRHRTTWADFMIGRTWEEESLRAPDNVVRAAAAEQARTCFRRTRTDAAAGFADSLGLVVASLGREARMEMLAGSCRAAINLYVAQLAAGDATAINSLLSAAHAAVEPGTADLDELAHDPVARGVITAFFLARARGVELQDVTAPINVALGKWALALRDAHAGETTQADRLAWLAYRAGQYALAEQWAALAPADAPSAMWIRAKLALRAGDLKGAAALLAQVAEGVSADQRKLAQAELGRTRLALDDHAGALTAWLDGGHWEDAAYLGEQVLRLDELRAYVEANCPAGESVGGEEWMENDWHGVDPAKARGYLRCLLARRLVREGHAGDASGFFPESLRGALAAYVEATRIGFDVSRPVEERAAAFWRAAQLMRERGLELWATELDPDWAISGADFDRGVAAVDRLRATKEFGPTAAERERLEKQPTATTRFSYRYRAADLAWWAASLLPNDSEETARILVEAGGWLQARDPRAAERFYQALVIRCGNTALGRAAAEKHWFSDAAGKESSAAPANP